MKMARFQTFWIQMRKNKPLDESYKTGQISGTKMAFYSLHSFHHQSGYFTSLVDLRTNAKQYSISH
ncbi:hypothetical protein Hanom_Chr12g01078921 [Helianthus anomalus]